jgi:Fic family protein
MKKFIAQLKSQREKKHPVELAALAHKELVFIHPFVDGNGRVGRLLMNLILLQEGFTITLIPPVVRPDYLRALEKAHTSDNDFIELIARMVRETQKDFLRLFR